MLVSKSLHALPAIRDRRGRAILGPQSQFLSERPSFARAERVTDTRIGEEGRITRHRDFIDVESTLKVHRTIQR